MSLISARFVKENVGTGGKSSWAGIKLLYLPFKLLVDALSPMAKFQSIWLVLNCFAGMPQTNADILITMSIVK